MAAASLRYIGGSASANTMRACRGDLNEFGDWCASQGQAAVPAAPAMVANYLARLADDIAAVATIERRLAAIAKAHAAAPTLLGALPSVDDPSPPILMIPSQ